MIYLFVYSIFLIASFKLLVYKYAVCRTRIAKNDLEITIPNRVHSSKNVPNILNKRIKMAGNITYMIN